MTSPPLDARATRSGAVASPGPDLDRALVASWVVVAGVAGVSVVLRALGVDWSGVGTYLVVAGLLVAVPHGAVDHLAPRWRRSQRYLPVLVLIAGYVALALVAWVVLRSSPGLGLAALLVLSVVHFGLGEATFHGMRRPGTASRGAGLAAALVVVLLPLLTHASEAAPYLRAMVPGWDGRLGGSTEVVLAGAVLAVALVAGAGAALRGRWVVAGELLLLVVLALAAPPAVAVATYIGWWHAVRHTGVLLAEERGVSGPLAPGTLARRAAAPTAGAAVVLAGLWVWSGGSALGFVSEQIWLLAALTVPHALVVAWLDRTREVAGR